MINLFKAITTIDNQTITIVCDSKFDYDSLLNLIYTKISENKLSVNIKHLSTHKIKLNENKENTINICLKKHYLNLLYDDIYGNVPKVALYKSSYVLLIKNNEIHVIKSRGKSYNKKIKISQFTRLIKINEINEKEIR